MDGHDTHENHDLKRVAYDLLDTEGVHIEIFCFPSKTTHKCQPLDVLIFSAVNCKWQAVCRQYLKQRIPINRFTVIPAYLHGTQEALTKALIARAFEKAGLYPVNCAVFGLEDFAPSQASSVVVRVTDTFPPEFPSSDAYDTSSDSEYLPESDMEVEDECHSSDANEMLGTPEELRIGSPAASPDPSPAQEQFNQPSEGPGDGQDTGPDTERVMEPVSGFMIAMANLEQRTGPMTHSAFAHAYPMAEVMPKVISFEEDSALSKEEMLHELQKILHTPF
ncbi:hypothetical protein BC827DRAFT_1159041 [Russula dissimulans]|nr:hypothetical protein BC827DRAFT_1159041 [Russula dissimulans]